MSGDHVHLHYIPCEEESRGQNNAENTQPYQNEHIGNELPGNQSIQSTTPLFNRHVNENIIDIHQVEDRNGESGKQSGTITTKAALEIPAMLCPDAVPGLLYNRVTDCKIPMYIYSPTELKKRIKVIPNEKVSIDVFTSDNQQVRIKK